MQLCAGLALLQLPAIVRSSAQLTCSCPTLLCRQGGVCCVAEVPLSAAALVGLPQAAVHRLDLRLTGLCADAVLADFLCCSRRVLFKQCTCY